MGGSASRLRRELIQTAHLCWDGEKTSLSTSPDRQTRRSFRTLHHRVLYTVAQGGPDEHARDVNATHDTTRRDSAPLQCRVIALVGSGNLYAFRRWPCKSGTDRDVADPRA